MINERNYKGLPLNQETFLVHLAWKILTGFGGSLNTLNREVSNYVGNIYGRTSQKTQFGRVNLMNELTADKMTIKVFFKFIAAIKLRKIEITIKATAYDNTEVTVTQEYSLQNFANEKAAQAEMLSFEQESKKNG